MWLPMRYMLLRLSVNMNVCCDWSFVDVRAIKRAYNSFVGKRAMNIVVMFSMLVLLGFVGLGILCGQC